MRLKGKVALVTGAAHERSIGWGIARALAAEGADVAVNDVAMPERLAERVAELQSMGVRGLALPGDVSDAEAMEAMVQQTTHTLGRLDICVANAGVIRWEHFLDITQDNLRAIVNVNLKGTANTCRSAARQMIEQGHGGRIIIISSVQTDMQFPITPVYGATKRAMHIFVGALALELAPHQITVNHVGPGWVMSPLNDVSPELQTPAGREAQRQAVPLKREGYPDEVGSAVVFFAASDGDYATGAFLRLDGGLGIGKYTA